MNSRVTFDLDTNTVSLDLRRVTAIYTNEGGEAKFYLDSGHVIALDLLDWYESGWENKTMEWVEARWRSLGEE